MDFLPLAIRSPKGGGGGGGGGGGKGSSSSSSGKSSSKSKGSSSSKSKGTKIKSGGGGFFSSDDDGDGVYGWPLWARILLLVGIIILVLFIIAFIHYAIKENKKRTKNKHKFRWGKVLWKAFKVATLLIIFTWLFKKLRGNKSEKKKPSTTSYAKLEEGQSMQNLAPADPHPPQYQPPAQKYEPMGYSGYYAPPPAATSMPPPPQPQTTGVSPMPTPPPPQQYPQFASPSTAPPPTTTATMGANADYYNAGAMPTPPPPSTVASTVSGVQPAYQANTYQPPPMAPPPGGYYQPPPTHQ